MLMTNVSKSYGKLRIRKHDIEFQMGYMAYSTKWAGKTVNQDVDYLAFSPMRRDTLQWNQYLSHGRWL